MGSTVAWLGESVDRTSFMPVRKKGGFFVLGMDDVMVGLGWLLTLGAMIFGVIYGALNWNREEDEQS